MQECVTYNLIVSLRGNYIHRGVRKFDRLSDAVNIKDMIDGSAGENVMIDITAGLDTRPQVNNLTAKKERKEKQTLRYYLLKDPRRSHSHRLNVNEN